MEEQDIARRRFDRRRLRQREALVEGGTGVVGAAIFHARVMGARVDAQSAHGRRGPADVDHARNHRVLLHGPVYPVLVHAEGADDLCLPLFVEARTLQDDVGPDELFRRV